VPKRNPSFNSKKPAKILARMLSDHEREASFRAACELLKKHDRDWHDLVAAIERADILADPVPDPKAAERQTNNAWIADAVLKRFDRFLDEAHKAFLQQVIDQPSRHDPATTYAALTDIIAEATAKARAHRRAKKR
jgi:hypothetical protein